jgi:two-component system, LytTR family, response regulator
MPAKKVLIIDDEEAARILIRQYLEDYDQLEIVGECSDGLVAVNSIDRLEPDLVFLDVQMPGLSGFQVIRQVVHIPQVVFTTAFDQYALKAFDSNAVDYLLKPYTKERFDQALAKVLMRNSTLSVQATSLTETIFPPNTAASNYYERILLESGTKMISLSIHDIIYLEAEKDYTRVHTTSKNYLSNFGISTLEQRLNPAVFTRIHRSFIVNIHYIKEVYKQNNDTYLVLKNEMTLKVSKGYVENIKKMMY